MIGGFIICPINRETNTTKIKKILNSVNAKIVIEKKEQLKFFNTKKDYFRNFDPNRTMGIFLN